MRSGVWFKKGDIFNEFEKRKPYIMIYLSQDIFSIEDKIR